MKQGNHIKWILAVIAEHERSKIEGDMQRFTNVDWVEIVEIAFRQGVSSILYYQLKQFELHSNVPSSALDELRKQFRDTLTKNIRLITDRPCFSGPFLSKI